MTTPTQGEHAQTALAHELFAAAQLAPGEGIEDAVSRIAAALTAAPSQPAAPQGGAEAPKVYLSVNQLLQAIEFATGGAPANADELETSIGFQIGHSQDDDGKVIHGMRCWLADYPEEGVYPLDEEPTAKDLAAHALRASHGQAPAGVALEELLILLGSKKAWPSYYFNHKDRYECCDCGEEHDDYAEITHAETCDFTQATADRKRIKELVEILKSSTPTAQAAPAAGAVAGPSVRKVFLVATGAEHEGEATYTRYDDAPPPLCDSECLYTAAPTQAAQADSAPAEAVQRILHLRADRERRVYVAGPMTGLPEYNFPLFNATAAKLRGEGWHVENPAEHGHVEGACWADYLRWDISRIATCGAIYLLPGWEKSKGAHLEVHIAGVLGLRVLLADGAEVPPADSVLEDAALLDWIQHNGATVEVMPWQSGYGWRFRVAGLHATTSNNIRESIAAARKQGGKHD